MYLLDFLIVLFNASPGAQSKAADVLWHPFSLMLIFLFAAGVVLYAVHAGPPPVK